MIKIDDALLAELGLGALPTAEKELLKRQIYETLEMRVGTVLAEAMSHSQLDEFEAFFEAKDESGAFAWLEREVPDYKDTVTAQFEALRREVSESVPEIVAMASKDPL